jgi:hypothetical protein
VGSFNHVPAASGNSSSELNGRVLARKNKRRMVYFMNLLSLIRTIWVVLSRCHLLLRPTHFLLPKSNVAFIMPTALWPVRIMHRHLSDLRVRYEF